MAESVEELKNGDIGKDCMKDDMVNKWSEYKDVGEKRCK